ncbi:MAG: YkgJ family cysteine cluster protein [Planctomycetaceae bacterium]|nr:YkgJ family cysteine cluster protein [Planctomycetaceae bacterium]
MKRKKATLSKKSAVTQACRKCNGKCCRYYALQIDTPTDWDEFDDIRWYLSHEDTSVFVEDGKWYLDVHTKCRYLSEMDYHCLNYELRPHICRKYDTDGCDLTGDGYEYEMQFTDDKQMEEYMRIKFGQKVFEKLEAKKAKRAR